MALICRSSIAFLHLMISHTLTFEAYETTYLPRNLLGRQGWLRNLKLGIIDYDNLLYLSAYGS